MKPRVILVTNLYPPDPGGRAEKMLRHVKYFARHEVPVDVLCPITPEAPGNSDTGFGDGTCFRIAPWGMRHLASLNWQDGFRPSTRLGRTYRALGMPAGYLRWVVPALKRFDRLAAERPYTHIVSVSNPLSIQLIGVLVKMRHPKLRFIAELRDPIVGYVHSRHNSLLNGAIEGFLAKFADHVIEWEDFCPFPFAARHGGATQKCTRIANVGFDPDDYSTRLDPPTGPDLFRITFTGGYYGEIEIWRLFFSAIRHLGRAGADFRFDHYGDWSEEQDRVLNTEYPDVRDRISLFGRVEKSVCVRETILSDVLLLILEPSEDNKRRVTSKFYDYLAAQRPVVALVPENSLIGKKLCAARGNYVVPLPMRWVDDRLKYERLLGDALLECYASRERSGSTSHAMQDLSAFSCAESEGIFARSILRA